jgi:hypothetical protein
MLEISSKSINSSFPILSTYFFFLFFLIPTIALELDRCGSNFEWMQIRKQFIFDMGDIILSKWFEYNS